MTDSSTGEHPPEMPSAITMEHFLTEIPPGKICHVESLFILRPQSYPTLSTPDISLYCQSSECQGMRLYEKNGSAIYIRDNTIQYDFLHYQCKNCEQSVKIFAVMHQRSGDSEKGEIFKFGEYPPFGPHTPARVVALIGPDRELFLSGRRCESQGLGIGAYTYYRRVVESQWCRLIDSVIKVAKRVGADNSMIVKLEETKEETQFSRALDDNKDIIPQALLIENHNPLFLLHSALSSGLHAKSDEECLVLATHIRIVLTELSDRLSQALKDHSGLREAVSKLLQAHKGKQKGS